VAYFIRRRGNVCWVIELHADNQEEVVEDGFSTTGGRDPVRGEIQDLPKSEQPPRGAIEAAARATAGPVEPRTRQLALKLEH
jgi:hypothetical protein